MNFNELKELLSSSKKIIITNHVRPDADAIGSTLALFHFLTQYLHHSCTLIFPTPYAPNYRWFPGIDKILVWENNKRKAIAAINEADLAFVVDFNEISRNGEVGKLIAKSTIPKILIDHHTDPEDIFDFRIWSTQFAAAAEGIYYLINEIFPAAIDNKDIASCLYAALVADSGSFRFQYTSPDTHRMAARLLETGIDHSEIHRFLYDNFTTHRLRMWGYCLGNKMIVLNDLPVAIISLSNTEFEQYSGVPGDTEGLVNFPLSIKKVEVSILIIERKDIVKISIRSKNHFPANEFAKNYYGGGGHVNAAGAETLESYDKAVDTLIAHVREYFREM